MEQPKHCPTILIEDIPTTQDSFKGSGEKGAHERVADAISELFRYELGGKVVGLEGKWGAGKSSVVDRVKEKCSNNSFAIVQFDAWAHSGDPLRRTFLEAVVLLLQEKRWLANPKKWKKTLDRLAKRISSNSRRVIPTISTLGTLFAIAVLFMPFGITLLSTRHDYIYYADLPDFFKNNLVWISLGIILSPLLVVITNFFGVFIKKYIFRRKIEASDLAFLTSHSLLREYSDSVQTPEPTSIEFEKEFKELMKDALDGKVKRRIVLVIDNLDRVEPKTALEIWSTLQAFIQEHHQRNDTWFSQLWILVPYDPKGLRKIWEQDSSDDQIAESFFDKSFQIRFQVPPPTLSNWKQFLCGLLQEALPSHGEPDQHTVYTIYNQFRELKSEPPTPRQLKLFVNQIGSIHRQWQDKYPLGDVAYYVLNEKKDNLLEQLKTGSIPKQEAKAILGDSLAKNMAGLAFNVEAEHGQQLLLIEPIYNALINCEADTLSNLESVHQEGFWAVLENVISDKVRANAPGELSKTARCLSKSGLLDGRFEQEINSIKRRLFKLTYDIEGWTPLNEEMAEGINIFCTLKNEDHFLQKIYTAVKAPLLKTQIKPEDVPTTANGLFSFLNTLSQLGGLDNQDTPVKLNMGAEEWFVFCQQLVENNVQLTIAEKIISAAKIEDIQGLLQRVVDEGRFSALHLNVICITPQTAYKNKWNDLIPSISAKLNAGSLNVKEVTPLFKAMLQIEKMGTGNARAEISRLANEGHLLHHLEQVRAEGDTRLKPLLLFAYLREKPDASMSGIVGNAQAGFTELVRILDTSDEAFAEIFLETLSEWNNANLLAQIYEKVRYKPFIIDCLRQVAKSESPETIFTPQIILDEWSALSEHLKDDFNKVLASLSQASVLFEKIKEEGFDFSKPELYIKLISQDSPEVPTFINWLITEIQTVNKDEWIHCLNEEPDIFKLMFWLRENSHQVILDTAFSDALREHAKQAIVGTKTAAHEHIDSWSGILSFIKDSIRVEFAEHLLDRALEAKGKIDSKFLHMYKNEVFNEDILSSNTKVISHLFTPLLEERSPHGLNWMKGFFKEHPIFLKRVKNGPAEEAFRNRLSHAIVDNPEDDTQKIINEIAQILGVKPPAPAAVDETKNEATNEVDEEGVQKPAHEEKTG